jgi:monoterpene epsilon-lactone hydrolase
MPWAAWCASGPEKGKADGESPSCTHDMAVRAATIDNGGVDDEGKLIAFPQAPEAIELRHMRAFVAVAEELNFGRAAERLYITQPALSRQIRSLEQFLGCELLRRSTHRVELTLAGEALLDRIRPVLRQVDAAVAAAQSVGGELVGRVARLWEPLLKAVASEADVQELRAAYEELHAKFSPPPEVEVRPVNAGGVPSLLVGQEPALPPTLLYLHGGGYMLGSAFGYRPLAGALAATADTGALVPDYRLAPEHPFPAAIEDALAAYRWMLDRGVEPGQVCVVGDSSGGGLAVSMLLKLTELGLPQPGGAVLFCPWVDLAMALPREGPNPEMSVERGRFHAAAYLGDHPIDDPVVTPLTADLRGLPPILTQAATGDNWLVDARALTERAREQGVDARLELYSVDAHVFQIFWSFLPEAADALESAGRFSRQLRSAEQAESA